MENPCNSSHSFIHSLDIIFYRHCIVYYPYRRRSKFVVSFYRRFSAIIFPLFESFLHVSNHARALLHFFLHQQGTTLLDLGCHSNICCIRNFAGSSWRSNELLFLTDFPDIFNAGGILSGILGLMVIISDYVCNIAMMRVALNIKLTNANTAHHQARHLFQFKRKMISLFVMLAVLDVCDCILVVTIYLGLVPNLSAAVNNLSRAASFGFYMPLHVLILYSLLDMFKRELLKPPSGTRNPLILFSVSIDSHAIPSEFLESGMNNRFSSNQIPARGHGEQSSILMTSLKARDNYDIGHGQQSQLLEDSNSQYSRVLI